MIQPFQHQKLFAEILPDRYVAVVDCRLKDCSSGVLPEKKDFPRILKLCCPTSDILLLPRFLLLLSLPPSSIANLNTFALLYR